MSNSKRSYSEINDDDNNTAEQPPKRQKFSHERPAAPPSLSPLSTRSASVPSNSATNNTLPSTSSSSSTTAATRASTNSNTTRSVSTDSHKRRKRRDLFDEPLDETYRNTQPTSIIPAPTLDGSALEKVWKEKAKASLLSFQRDKRPESQTTKKYGNPIMQTLIEQTELIEPIDGPLSIKLQEIVLELVYSSQSQMQNLRKPRNRRRCNRYNNADQQQQQNLGRRYDASWYERLPGPQPHSITRQNLERLRSYYYWVTEKSDGIRFMMLLATSPSHDAYLVGRKFEFYRILHPFYTKYLNDVSGATLLDGELIINQQKQLEYLAFDLVGIGGKSYSNNCTSSRIDVIKKFTDKYTLCTREFKQSPPIIIRRKHHYKSSELKSLLDKITCDEEGEYWFQNEVRRTRNDGLIFTPQENNFLMSYDPGALVKWKFLEKNTIDLKVKTPYIFRNKLDLYAGGKGNSDILFAQIDMKPAENREKFYALLNEMQSLSDCRHGFVNSFIVECAWNFKSNQWQLIQNRPDKHIPNFITVCTDTLRVMTDNVTENELIDACSPTAAAAPPTTNHNNYSNHNNQHQHRYNQHNNYNNSRSSYR